MILSSQPRPILLHTFLAGSPLDYFDSGGWLCLWPRRGPEPDCLNDSRTDRSGERPGRPGNDPECQQSAEDWNDFHIMGGIILLFGAGGVVGQLQTSLNTIWGVTAQSDSGLRDFIRKRFVSFAMVLGVGFLLLVSLTVSAFISGLTQFIGSRFEGIATIAHLLDILISFGFVTLLFAMIYKFLPDVEIQWQDVWTGAALTSILFTIGKFLIGLYLGSSGITSIYGAAGSLITVILWVYYSSLIFLLGAEFTEVYANTYGSGVVPTENAESVSTASYRKAQTGPPGEATSLEPLMSAGVLANLACRTLDEFTVRSLDPPDHGNRQGNGDNIEGFATHEMVIL